MKWQVFRLNRSPYQPPSFELWEKELLEQIKGVKVCLSKEEITKDPLILISNTHTDSKDLLKYKNQLKLVIHPNSGHDHFSYKTITKLKCPLLLGNSIRAQAVHDFCLSAVMNYGTPLKKQIRWDKNREFKRKTLAKLKVLIMGYGHVGVKLEKSLKALNTQVSIFDPHKGFSKLKKDKFDVIILTMSLNKLNLGLINKAFLNLHLKEDGCLINPARGELVIEQDLLDFLSQNKNAKAYIDVYAKEPCDLAKYKKLKNLITSSHIAGVFTDLNSAILAFEYEAILQFTLDKKVFRKRYKDQFLMHPKRIYKKKFFL